MLTVTVMQVEQNVEIEIISLCVTRHINLNWVKQ